MEKEEKKNNDFDFKKLPPEAQNPEISEKDFVLVSNKNRTHEQKFQTKPTTFFKDSIKRFRKNKSSVVAAVILGLLLVLSIIIPVASSSDVSTAHTYLTYLEPKLFDAGTGVWDGTKSYSKIATDISFDPTGEDKENNWWPNPDRFERNAVSKKQFSDVTYTSDLSSYGTGGYIQTGYYNNIDDNKEYTELKTIQMTQKFDVSVNHYISVFDIYDLEKIKTLEENDSLDIPENYELGEAAFYFNYINEKEEKESIEILPYKGVHNVGSFIKSLSEDRVNISEIVKVAEPNVTLFDKVSFSVRVKNNHQHKNTCVLIRSICFETEEHENEKFVDEFLAPSFIDATECALRPSKIDTDLNPKCWATTGTKAVYLSKVIYCSFVYDSYEAELGTKMWYNFSLTTLEQYRRKGWINFNYDVTGDSGSYHIDPDTFECEILDPVKSPLAKEIEYEDMWVDPDNLEEVYVDCLITYYKYYDYTSMPRFIFGTDKSGRDMLKYVFEGLRTSLLLGIVTTLVCFLFGLLWGSISGYFGGTTDLVMERFTDILSGVPWIVVMTLVIIHMGSNFFTFALALCLTGWIGTAATTRTQFYRFRGREYVLASRTLGASDARLIGKHILPNAMGTIITSSVLMVPSVIFSEATISYLGLGLKNLSSLGVILSNNQTELVTSPHLLIFPAIIIALLMISFNLFGNGLRDAVNPSLKGED